MTEASFSLPPATEFAHKAAEKRAAEEERRRQMHEIGDTHRAELIETLLGPQEINVDEVLRRAATLIRSASDQGLNEVLAFRYPCEILADHGRAIVGNDPDWPSSLRGRPLVLFNIWREHLRPLGYGLRAEILDYRNDVPGDAGSFLFWGNSGD
ncbi:hypothetical protein [Pseudochelatococcus sp. G4_1912]|jgi:hypothetical protein|uniref:hypothetical protein n=1 Tax=Pseudochelatococcus sp. G4_1912 TaxID=3114288 RepID=UPI0039C68E93